MQTDWIGQIREWGGDSSPGNARNLIRAFRQCDSGEVRLEILGLLGRFSDRRSHGFLVDVVRTGTDLAEREGAVRSIGRRRSASSRRILRRFLDEVPPDLETSVLTALGQARAYGAVPVLIARLDRAIGDRDAPVLKALAVSLGELKGTEALGTLQGLLHSEWIRADRELALAVLFALGRLGRDPASIEPFGVYFSGDPFACQVFESVSNQVQLRSQVRIEDYLHRIFHLPDPHPGLPLELRAFDSSEVATGLTLFDRVGHLARHLFCLKALPPREQSRLFEGLVIPEADRDRFLEALSDLDELSDPATILRELDLSMPGWCDAPGRRLARIAAVPQTVDWLEEARRFSGGDESGMIALLNHWSDWNPVLPEDDRVRIYAEWIHQVRTPAARARLLRSAAEARVCVKDWEALLPSGFSDPSVRDSVLQYATRTRSPVLLDSVRGMPGAERSGCLPEILAYIEALLTTTPEAAVSVLLFELLSELLPDAFGAVPPETTLVALRILQRSPLAGYEERVIACMGDPDPQVRLSALAAIRGYPDSSEAVPPLVSCLEFPLTPHAERALDALCRSRVPAARSELLGFLAVHPGDEAVVERVLRGLYPGYGDDAGTVRMLREIATRNRFSPQAVKLEELLGRFAPGWSEDAQTSPELERIDSLLRDEIPRYDELDGTIRLALRAAEQPFLQSGALERLPIDKAPTVLQYCKALDLVLDRYLGQRLLFPEIDDSLPEFQRIWHRLGFVEGHPPVERVIYLLGLKGRIAPEHFPLHKAKMMCGAFFNGRIMQDRYKVFDGLRAWAVIFLLFTRAIPGKAGVTGPVVPLRNAPDGDCLDVAVKLMGLQDLRNPAAHRQTYPDLDSVRTVRRDSLALVNRILDWVL